LQDCLYPSHFHAFDAVFLQLTQNGNVFLLVSNIFNLSSKFAYFIYTWTNTLNDQVGTYLDFLVTIYSFYQQVSRIYPFPIFFDVEIRERTEMQWRRRST